MGVEVLLLLLGLLLLPRAIMESSFLYVEMKGTLGANVEPGLVTSLRIASVVKFASCYYEEPKKREKIGAVD
ncbi:MAG: hypothetical protein J3R72DRAFT_438136, partial [Linnemannia gamsii]